MFSLNFKLNFNGQALFWRAPSVESLQWRTFSGGLLVLKDQLQDSLLTDALARTDEGILSVWLVWAALFGHIWTFHRDGRTSQWIITFGNPNFALSENGLFTSSSVIASLAASKKFPTKPKVGPAIASSPSRTLASHKSNAWRILCKEWATGSG